MQCRRCTNESTGILIQLCDDCFSNYEAEIKANPDSVDLTPIDPRLKYKKDGGTVPNHVKAVAIVPLHTEPN